MKELKVNMKRIFDNDNDKEIELIAHEIARINSKGEAKDSIGGKWIPY